MTEKVKNLLRMIISAVGMVALVLTTVFCLVTPESIRKDPNTITSPTDYQVSASPLIKSGGVVDADVLAALLTKVGALEASNSTTQKHLGQINGGNPVTVKLFDTVSTTTNNINSLTSKYWQPVYRTGNILTLWMVEPYTTAQFNDSTSKGKDYVSSDIQKLMVSIYTTLNTTFNLNTKNFVATPNDLPVKWQTGSPQKDSTKYSTNASSTTTADNNLMNDGLESDKLWLPSFAEVFNNTTETYTTNYSDLTVRNGLWQTNYRDRSYTNNSTSDYAWLRSAPSSYPYGTGACLVGNDGGNNYGSVTSTYGVRPALHLNLSSLQADVDNQKGGLISGEPLIKSGGAVDAVTLSTLLDKMGGLEPTGSEVTKDLSTINGGTPLTLKLFDTVADTTNALDKLTASYWQVVYRTGNVLTLWMTAPYTTTQFNDSTSKGKDYVSSDIQKLMVSTYTTLNTTFNLNTKNFVATPAQLPVPWQTGLPQLDTTNYSTGSTSYDAQNNLMNDGLENDKLWLPSYAEVFNNTTGTWTYDSSSTTVRNGLWQTNNRDRTYTNNSTSNYAWLRSANSSTDATLACLVRNDGNYHSGGVGSTYGVRPALHLNLNALYEASLPNVTATVDRSLDENALVNGSTSYSGKPTSLPMTLTFNTSANYWVDQITLNGSRNLTIPATNATAGGVTYSTAYSADKRTLTLTLTAVTADASFSAHVTTTYNIGVTAQPAEGGTVSTTATSISPGTAVTLTATPTAPYTFRGWYENGATLLSDQASYTFTPTRSMNIVGLFYADGGYEAEAISADPTMGSAALKSVKGTTAIFMAIPNPGYTFAGWFTAATGGTAVSTANPYTVNMTGNTTLYARFTVNAAEMLFIATTAGGEARIAPGSELTVGSAVTVVAVPYLGYTFGGWINIATGATVSNEPSYRFTLTAPTTLRANFVVTTFTASSLSINHAADLVKLANLVNSGQTLAGVTVTLERDLDIGALSQPWETIGTASTKFAGIFQGNGHTITNSGASNLNLFATGTTAQVYNLSLGEKVVAGAIIQNNGLLPVAPEPDDWATINPGGR